MGIISEISAETEVPARPGLGHRAFLATALGAQAIILLVTFGLGNWAGWLAKAAALITYWSTFLSLSICLVTVATAALTARRAGERRLFGFIATALGLIIVGELIENLNYLRNVEKILDFNDLFFVLSNVVIIAMQIGHLKHAIRNEDWRKVLFDFFAAFMAASIVLLFLYTVSKPAFANPLPPRDVFALRGFVLLDIVIIFNFLALFIRAADASRDIPALPKIIIFLGLFSLVTSDLLWAVDKLNVLAITSVSASSIMAIASYMIIGSGLLVNQITRDGQWFATRPVSRELMDEVAGFVYVLAALLLIFILGYDNFRPDGRKLYIALTFLVVILLVRQALAFRKQLELRTQLAISSTETRLSDWYRQQALDAAGDRSSTAGQSDPENDAIWLSDDDRARLVGQDTADPLARQRRLAAKSKNLAAAIDLGWFEPWYQPIHDIQTGDIRSIEVLARCVHPERGLLTPQYFIPDVERADLGSQLLRQLLPRSLEELRSLTTARLLPDSASLAVNMAARDFDDPRLAADLANMMQEAAVPMHRLCLELTERMVANSASLDRFGWQTLRNQGVQFCIDDFGTGYSSLAYLERFQPNAVKIDKSFIDEIDQRKSLADLVGSIADMTNRLNIQMIVEGVEMESQLTAVRALGGRYIQGFLLSEPMPAAALRDALRSGKLKSAAAKPPADCPRL